LKKRYGLCLIAVARDNCWLPAGNNRGGPRMAAVASEKAPSDRGGLYWGGRFGG